jgi:hypothetical protein
MDENNLMPVRMESKDLRKDRISRYLFGWLVVLVVSLALFFFAFHPHWPVDIVGWLILILVGIPISFCLRWIEHSIFRKEIGQKISAKKFSVKRIIFSLLVFAFLTGVFALLWFVFGSLIRPHFS